MSTMRRRGFTLIELLIVVVVIGILATIAIPKFTATREKAFTATIASDLKNLASLQAVYHSSNYTYTTVVVDTGLNVTAGVNIFINEATISGWAATATHDGLPGGQCGFYEGDASPANGTPATQAAVVTC